MRDNVEILRKLQSFCDMNDVALLFGTIFGSDLYGTSISGKSDLDIRGIFLPPLSLLALNRVPRHLKFSTGDEHGRNNAQDIDMDLWSLQYWLLELLPQGDTGAVDILFAPSNANATLYIDRRLNPVFANPRKFLNITGTRSYSGYAMRQAKKYGIRGSRLGIIKRVHDWLNANVPAPDKTTRLAAFLDGLIADCADARYCSIVNSNGEKSLQLCGKIHHGSTRMNEFARRVREQFDLYGQRAIMAANNEGLDFKALSHAMRALFQIEELVSTGKIVYPLKDREELIAIKKGKYSWNELESMIVRKLNQVDELCEAMPAPEYDIALAERIILDFYNIATEIPDRKN